jgi:hypothetical protein
MSIQRQAIRGRDLLDVISARQIVVRSAPAPSSPAPSAHRCAAWGLTAQRSQTKRHSCLYGVLCAECRARAANEAAKALMPT